MEQLFYEQFQAQPELRVTAAGRINLIGEHVDYCGGKVFPAALNLNSCILARRNGMNCIRIYADDLKIGVSFDLDALDSYRNLKWGNYQAGVAYVLQQKGYPLVGCDLLYHCSVPFGSGLSSSASIEVATAVALNEMAGNAYELKEMAVLSQKAENEYCGVNCGIMDQFASAMGKKDKAILLNCKTLDYEYIPLELGDYRIVVANCNKPHNLVESKYNERRGEVEQALEALRTVYPDLACLADLSVEAFGAAKHVLSGKVLDRATHVVEECDRVKRAVAALQAGDLFTLGKLITASHESLSKLYEVTGKEPDALAAAAWKQEGCIGSRMIGAGFGGCTISLVRKDCVPAFIENVGKEYESAIGYRASFYDTSVEDGVTVTKL